MFNKDYETKIGKYFLNLDNRFMEKRIKEIKNRQNQFVDSERSLAKSPKKKKFSPVNSFEILLSNFKLYSKLNEIYYKKPTPNESCQLSRSISKENRLKNLLNLNRKVIQKENDALRKRLNNV